MRSRYAVLVAALALFAGACGGDRGDDSASSTDTDGSEESSDSTDVPADTIGDFGDLTGVCGPNEGGGEVPTDVDDGETQGITADTIQVGTVADPSYTGRPGLNQEIFDAATAFVEWCNAAGGINGKRLDVALHDAAITNYQPVVEEACAGDFALVGAGAVLDNLWPEVGAACGLIDIAGFSVTPQKAGVAGDDLIERRSVQAVPNPGDRMAVGANRLVGEEFADAGGSTGFIYGDLQTLVVTYEKMRSGFETAGQTVVHATPYAILGESNWQPFALGLQRDGVEFLTFVGEGENLAQLQQAMSEIGYQPQVTLQETNFYDQEYLNAAGDAAEGTFIRTVNWPFEEADANPATAQYLDLVEAVDGKVAVLGVQSMSAWLMFAQAAKACDLDDDLTRSCVLDAAASIESWTGGGLHAETNPAANEGPECVIVLRVEGGQFTRYAPDDGYHCDPADIVTTPIFE